MRRGKGVKLVHWYFQYGIGDISEQATIHDPARAQSSPLVEPPGQLPPSPDLSVRYFSKARLVNSLQSTTIPLSSFPQSQILSGRLVVGLRHHLSTQVDRAPSRQGRPFAVSFNISVCVHVTQAGFSVLGNGGKCTMLRHHVLDSKMARQWACSPVGNRPPDLPS